MRDKRSLYVGYFRAIQHWHRRSIEYTVAINHTWQKAPMMQADHQRHAVCK